MVWASSLVPEAVLDHCRPAVVLFDSKTMTLEEVTPSTPPHPEAAIVRLHSGDPSVYGAIAEQIDWCVDTGSPSRSCRGDLHGRGRCGHRAELTLPGVSQTWS